METGAVRRVLAVKPDGPWLVLVDGTTWNVEPRNPEADKPSAFSRPWLLPLLERPREELERRAREIAVGRSSVQATQHAAKRLLKENGHWPPSRPPACADRWS
ncbi:hypothetical protein AB0L05_34905 [Nonomuraea pusilla]|uniref:hypothetical protein n=1 Tax=Nonomuraea pusilla TaxID=46177 RepID=UPI00332B3C2E